MEILDEINIPQKKYKFNIILKLMLLGLFLLGGYFIRNMFYTKKEFQLLTELISPEIFTCWTSMETELSVIYLKLQLCYFIGGIISIIVLGINRFKLSKEASDNLILFSPLLLVLTGACMW